MSGVTFTYQWTVNDGTSDADITGATDSTHTLVAADEGKTIKVEVSFTDDAGNGESLTSAPTAAVAARPNTPATGQPTIIGTAQAGERLTADTTGIADADGLTGATFAYQWLADDAEIAGATGSTYDLTSSEMDRAIKVRVSFTDDGGNDETLTSAATGAVSPAAQQQQAPNRPATGAPTISGTAKVGETLTADVSGITDADGLDNVSYSYQWIRNDGNDDADITGATSSTHTLVDADQGKTIKVKATFTDDAGNDETLTSEATFALSWPVPLQAQSESSSNLASISVSVVDGAAIDLGTFDPTETTYSATVASTVERVTVEATASSPDRAGVYFGPRDASSVDVGHQVNLNYGTNLILISVSLRDEEKEGMLKTYSVEITREGTASAGSANTVSIHAQYQHYEGDVYPAMASEGSTFPFVLTRTGDTSESLTVQVGVSENNDTMWLPSESEETVTVEFEAGHASARLGVETTSDDIATGTYHLYARLVSGTGYQVDSSGRIALWFVWEDDYNKLNVAEITVTDSNGAVVDIGAFDPAETSYTGSVAAEVEFVTVALTVPNYLMTTSILPRDSQPDIEGHQVDLSYGANQVIVAVQSRASGQAGTNTYSLQINRPGSAVLNSSAVVSAFSIPWAREGDSIPFLLTRIGDTSEALTVQVDVTESGGDMLPTDSKGVLDVEFQAGHASAGFNVSTKADENWEDHSTVRVAVQENSSYQVSTDFGSASTLVIDNDVPAVTAALTVDSTEVEEGDEVTATITVTTDGPKELHGYVGNLYIRTDSGTAREHDFELQGLNNASLSVHQSLLKPVENNGVVTTYQAQYSATILITDDERPEADESFSVYLEIGSNSKDALTLDDDSRSHTITILGQEETPASPDSFGYATVVVEDYGTSGSTFTVTWTDAETCATYYYADLWYAENPAGKGYAAVFNATLGTGLGSTEDGGTQITRSLNDSLGIGTDFVVKLYCSQRGLVSEVPIPAESIGNGEKPKPGTYHSEPALTGLNLSSGTLSPAFSKFGILYAVLDVPNDQEQITLNPTVKPGYTISWDPQTDANFNTPGHQVDLDIGYNTIYLAVDHNQGGKSFNYEIIVKRAEGSAQANSPATGAPAVTGTVQVGETLMADTTGIADADGLANVSYSYQWLADDAEIASATENAQVLTSAELGRTIKVRVSFTDDGGNDEVRTSGATDAVSPAVQQPPVNTPATGAPAIRGTAHVGETLTADTSGIADTDGLSNVSYSYQWIRNNGTSDTDITDATDSSYTLVADDEGKTVKVRVSLTDDAGNDEILTSTATEAVSFAVQHQTANSSATGAPAISGTAEVGEKLTADTTGIADADGLSGATFSYQWVANDGIADTDITGATHSTYTLVAADEGKTIKVELSFTDDAGNGETLTSEATAEVAAAGPPGHITVAVTKDTSDPNNIVTNVTVTWSDADNCSTNYNAYLIIGRGTQPGHETPESQLDLGSAAFDGAQITKRFSDVPGSVGGEVAVELYCGTDGSGRLVSRVGIPWYDGLKPGTYSSEPPLIALSVSHGTLTPTFNSHTNRYAIPDVDNADTRITITVTPKTGYYVDFYEGSADFGLASRVSSHGDLLDGLSAECEDSRGYADDFGPLIELTDADPDMPGFQVDLYDGDSHVHVLVHSIAHCDLGTRYILAITRAEGSVSSPLPNRPPTGLPIIGPDEDAELRGLFGDMSQGGLYNGPQVGQTIDAIVWLIRDRDGLVTGEFSPDGTGSSHLGPFLISEAFSFQWLADGAEITGATSSYYTVPDTGLGKTLKVRVSFTDDRGTEETVTSVATGMVKLRNFVPTGRPIIVGTLEVGQTLRADVSRIRDRNGMTNSTFGYVWHGFGGPVRDGEEYTLADSDAGRNGRVDVTYTDDAGHEATVRSATTGVVVARPNSPATGAPDITGTVQVGETLTADTSSIADTDGLVNVSYGYQWVANDGTSDTDITGATDSTYTLVADDDGKTIKVEVSFTDDAGSEETLTSTATQAVSFAVQQQIANSAATGAPAIRGTVQVGETLTVDTLGIADADGLINVSYRHQWIRNNGTSDTEITSETDSSYTLISADEGQTIKVRVSFTDDAGNQEMLTSAPTAVVAAPAQVDSENEPSEWSHLTVAVTEDDSDPDNVVSTFTITWNDAEDCSASYNAYLDGVVGDPIHLGSAASEGDQIAGSLTNVSAETFGFNANLHCGTIGSGRLVDRLWIPEYNRSIGTLPISRAYLPKPGTYSTEPGLIALTVSSGTLTPAFHNQTLNYTVPDVPNADGRFTVTTTAKADYYNVAFIPGSYHTFFSVCSYGGQQTSLSYSDDAGNRIYPLTDADANTPGFQMDLDEGENVFYIRVWPNCVTGQLYKLTVTRAASAPANTPATGAPTIGGTARVGQPLTADTTGIADSDGLENATFAYQWLADDTEIDGATHSTYTLVVADEGQTIKVEVSFTDDAGNDETLTSTATAEVAAAAPTDPPGAPRNLTGIANSDGTVTLRWDAPNDDSVSGYQILRRRPREGEKTLLVHVNDTGSTDTEYTDNDVTPDVGHAYRVKAINAVGLGRQSKFVNVTPTQPAGPAQNSPATGTPTISGTAQVGETLTADTSGIGDDDGLANVTFSYQWIASDEAVDIDITSATVSSYTLVDADEGQTIQVQVSFTDDAGNDESLTSAATAPVPARPNTPATGAPTISGTAQVGETLAADTSGIADTDGLTNVTYSYQWLGDDTDIAGATSSTYTLAETDEGKTVKVRVSFTDDRGNSETGTSAATAVVAVPEPPAKPTGLSAAVSHDAVTLTWDDPQDDAITGYVILRRDRAIHPTGTFVTIAGDTGSADTTYTDDTVEPDKEYVYRIEAINEHGKVSEISDWVRADTPAAPVPDKPTGLSAAVSHDTVTLTWDDPQDDTITGYVILRRDREIHPTGTFVTIAGDTGSAQTTYTDDTVEPDKEYVYRIEAINEHGEVSEKSHWLRADTPAAPSPAG